MNRFFLVKTFSFVVFTAIISISGFSQTYLKETEQVKIGNTSVSISIPKKSTVFGNINRIKSANLLVQLDLNNIEANYIVGLNGSNEAFEYEFSFSLLAFNSEGISIGKFEKERYVLKINNNNPIKTLSVNLKYALLNAKIEDLSIVQIENPQLVLVQNPNLISHIRTIASVEVEYSQGVTFNDQQLLSPPLIENQSINGKSVTFKWTYPYPFTQYQIQLLKLENKKENLTIDNEIDANIDWAKSIPINITVVDLFDEAENLVVSNSATVTIGEGNGFYAWRIRPIGNYADGGIANSANWGAWSSTETGEKSLIKSNLPLGYFYFSDPDANINSMFGRVFTEENKVKEISTFANGLNQVQQTKTYLPTNDVTLTSQSLTDYSGRSALSTLPMPTPGKNGSYSKGFMTVGGVLYTEKNFADKSKTRADYADELREMVYYNSNPDPRIPDSRGVPFSQSTFYGDPLNRVKEEGAPGRLHMISNEGKTVKYFYGTPSETELYRVFGPQAPDNETVSKMVKVDPNNVATITYTSSEGKVIATCLSYFNESLGTLEPIDGIASNNLSLIEDDITRGVSTDWGFISSKRIVILQNTLLKVNYVINQNDLENSCSTYGINCNYRLDIIIHNAETNEVVSQLLNEPLEPGGNYYYLKTPYEIANLNPGSYVIEKRLRLGEASFDENKAKEMLTYQIKPLKDLISFWLDNLTCPDQIDAFQDKLLLLSKDLKNHQFTLDKPYLNNLSPEVISSITNFYNSIYTTNEGFLNQDKYKLTRWKVAENGDKTEILDDTKPADLVILETPCCKIPISVKWLKRFNLYQEPILRDLNGDLWPTPKNTETTPDNEFEIVPDFEGYALAFFNSGDCDLLRDGKFYQYMNGWGGIDATGKRTDGFKPGTFNLMVYHMLTDNLQQYAKNPFIEEDIKAGVTVANEPTVFTDECGNVVDISWQNGVYNTKDLFECWVKQLNDLKEKVCDDFDSSESGLKESVDVLNNVEGDDAEGPQKVDKSVRKMLRKVPWWKRGKVARKVRRQIRNASKKVMTPDEGKAGIAPIQINLVKGFLDCAGYSFVKILTPYDPEPVAEDKKPNEVYFANLNEKPFKRQINKLLTPEKYFESQSKGNGDYYYYPLRFWGIKKLRTDGSISNELLIKYIKNPIYAFKYFEHENEGRKEYASLEASTCYDDPNDCFDLDSDGWLKTKPNLPGFKKKPCCVEGTNKDFCYEDREYPSLIMLNAQPGDPLFIAPSDPRWVNPDDNTPGNIKSTYRYANGKFEAKYIVQDWEEGGRLKCPYDHYSWSSGQRYTFWDMLNNFSKLPDEDGDSNNNDVIERTCSDLIKPVKWYHNTDTLFQELPEFVTEKEYPLLFTDEADQPHTLQQYTDYPHLRFDKTLKPDKISYVEWEIASMRNECFDSCATRKDEIRKKVIDAFERNCYEIGGCPECENVVMVEDIDRIVQKIIDQCNNQCNSLKTFGCYNMDVRSLDHYRKEVGPTERDKGVLFVGIAGVEKMTASNDYASSSFDDLKAKKTNYDIDNDNNDDDEFEMIRVDVGGNSIGAVENFSFYEYVMYKQATEWDIEINFPSMCDNYILEAENATKIKNAVATPSGVSSFRNFDPVNEHLVFSGVDFGNVNTGTLKIVVRYKVNATINLGKQIFVEVGGVKYTVPNNTYSEDFIEYEITLNSRLYGVHNLELSVYTTSYNNPTDITIDWVKLVSTPGAYSKIREFSLGKPNEGDTFLPKKKFEVEEIKIEDPTLPKIGDPVVSPTKNIKVVITE